MKPAYLNYKYVIIDASMVDRAYKIDSSCQIIESIIDAYGGIGIGDHVQLAKKQHCPTLTKHIKNHDITDEEVVIFTSKYEKMPKLRRLMAEDEDPVDLKLLLFARDNPSCALITCDKRLLYCAADFNLKRACFKAALHHADHIFGQGSIYEDDHFETDKMFQNLASIIKDDPFFYYSNNSKCKECHPAGNCSTLLNPPVYKEKLINEGEEKKLLE